MISLLLNEKIVFIYLNIKSIYLFYLIYSIYCQYQLLRLMLKKQIYVYKFYVENVFIITKI